MHGNKEKAIRTVALAGNDETEMLRLFEELTAAPICELPKNGAKGYFYYKYRKYELTALFGKFTNESVKDFDTVVFILPAVKIEREITDAFICARSCKSAIILLTDYKRAKKNGQKNKRSAAEPRAESTYHQKHSIFRQGHKQAS